MKNRITALILAIGMIAMIFVSCDDAAGGIPSEAVSSTVSLPQVPTNVSAEASFVDVSSSSDTTTAFDKKAKLTDLEIAQEGEKADISLNEALKNYTSAEIDGKLYIVQADNADKDVIIKFLKYNTEEKNLEKVMSFRVENASRGDLETSLKDYMQYERSIYKSVDGNTVLCLIQPFSFNLYIDVTNKKPYVFETGTSPKQDSIRKPDKSVPTNEISETHPEYGDLFKKEYVTDEIVWVEYLDGEDERTVGLYNCLTKDFTVLRQTDKGLEKTVIGDGKYIVYASFFEEKVYCCDTQTAEVKQLPVTDRILDEIGPDGESSYALSDLRVEECGGLIYWQDYDEKKNTAEVCAFNFETGKNKVIYKLDEKTEIKAYKETKNGVYIKAEPRAGASIYTVFDGALLFYDGKETKVIAENIRHFHILEDGNLIFTQKVTENSVEWKEIK